jgi:hypothetical protein
MDVKMKQLTLLLMVKGDIEVAGWENLTTEERERVVERLQALLLLSKVVGENAHEW